MCYNGSFWPPKFLKLISRKFWVVGNFCFHIVYNLQSEISVKSHYGVFFFAKVPSKWFADHENTFSFRWKCTLSLVYKLTTLNFWQNAHFFFFAQRTSSDGYFYQIVCFAKEIYKKQFFNLLRVHDDFNKMVLICQKITYLVFTISKVD